MADSVVSGAKVPQSFGEKLAFGFPIILLTLILAVGIGYVIVLIIDGNTRTMLEQTNNEVAKVSTQVTALDKTTKELSTSVDKVKKDLESTNKSLNDLVKKADEINTNLTKTSDSLSKFVDSQTGVDKGQNQDIAEHTKNLGDLNQKVTYINQKLEVLKKLEEDVKGLRTDTDKLQSDYVVLRTDLTATSKKADITDKDLTDLSERTRLFQLRVLAARAREAADAARKMDMKTLLDRIQDAE